MTFDALMEDLKREYVSELPSKIEHIRSSLKSADLVVVREDFHKLKGTGKTYGIPEISEPDRVVNFN